MRDREKKKEPSANKRIYYMKLSDSLEVSERCLLISILYFIFFISYGKACWCETALKDLLLQVWYNRESSSRHDHFGYEKIKTYLSYYLSFFFPRQCKQMHSLFYSRLCCTLSSLSTLMRRGRWLRWWAVAIVSLVANSRNEA